MCAKHNGELYCGMQSNENRINKIRKCPIKKKKQGGLLVTDSFGQRNRESGNRKSRGWLPLKKIMANKKAKNRKRAKMLKRKSIAEYKAKKRRERKNARRSAQSNIEGEV